ncbi:MAG: DUF1207 domain-containing protein [Saprospiraceae bacterium]
MKNIFILIIILAISQTIIAQDSTDFHISIKDWNLQIVSLDNFYPTYLADPLGNRTEVNSQSILYGDIDMEDNINEEDGGYKGRLVIFPGTRISLLKFTKKSNPKIGIEAEVGVTLPIFMRAGNHDVIGVDGIYYFAVSGSPTEWMDLRFSKHHICTHLGDEYAIGTTSSVVDFDPNIMQLPVRDDFILSAAVRPLYFLKNPHWDILQVYGEVGYFFPGTDFLGRRQNKPHRNAYMNYQGGIELEYYFRNKNVGGLYAATNISAYQLNAFSPNLSINAGYIVPQKRDKRKLRLGVNYYNGRSLMNQFYNRKEKFIAFSLALDM